MIQKQDNGRKRPLSSSPANTFLTLPHGRVWECRERNCGLQFAHPQLDEKALARGYSGLCYPPGGKGSREIVSAIAARARRWRQKGD